MKKARQSIKGAALILFWAFLMAMVVRNIKAVSIVSRCNDSIDVYNKLAVCADKCGLDDSCAYYIRKANYWIDSANRTLRGKTPKTRRSFKELRKKYGGGCHCDVQTHVDVAEGCGHPVQEIPHAFLFSDLSAASTSYLDPQSSICKICPVDTGYRDYLNANTVPSLGIPNGKRLAERPDTVSRNVLPPWLDGTTTGNFTNIGNMAFKYDSLWYFKDGPGALDLLIKLLHQKDSIINALKHPRHPTPPVTSFEWTTNPPSYSYFDSFNLFKWPLPPLADSLFPVWLLITDTSHLIYHHTADPQGNKIDEDVDVGVNNWGAFMIPGYSVLRKKWDRWGEQEYWEPTGYLDDKKRPLPVTVVVWGEMAR